MRTANGKVQRTAPLTTSRVEIPSMKPAKQKVQPMARRIIQPPTAAETVEVVPTSMHTHDLSIEQPAVVAYLQGIDARNQGIALMHGVQVGIMELVSRRARARAAGTTYAR